ncbi:MAG TPA: hypothetical protein VFB31_08335 [Pseudolabrys sp.]|nr:hypothetical protein [Pseudolabrys sp.]
MKAEKFETLIEKVAREIVATEHDVGGAFIRTPLLYPSGATVVVRIQQGENRYFVSDWGLGYQETDLYGAGTFYMRHARTIAEKAGVGFDNQAFFIMEASREQLAGAAVTIANCSQEAAMRAADAQAEKTFEDSKERLYERLVSVFAKKVGPTKKVVTKNAHVIGHSSTEWPIATLVRLPGAKKQTIFEPVTKHHNSVAHATMKFHDIALLGKDAPTRVAIVHKKKEFGTFLGVLSQAASVIDEDVSDETITRLADAA